MPMENDLPSDDSDPDYESDIEDLDTRVLDDPLLEEDESRP